MLKSASVLAAATLAAAAFAGSASAATIAPAGASFTLTGNLTLSQSTTVTCAVTLTGTVNATGTSASITGGSFAPGSWQCGWLVVPSAFPWTVTPGTGPTVTVAGITASSILGSCSGTITAAPWTNGPPSRVTFGPPNNTIPGSPNACTITGTLTSSPTLTIT